MGTLGITQRDRIASISSRLRQALPVGECLKLERMLDVLARDDERPTTKRRAYFDLRLLNSMSDEDLRALTLGTRPREAIASEDADLLLQGCGVVIETDASELLGAANGKGSAHGPQDVAFELFRLVNRKCEEKQLDVVADPVWLVTELAFGDLDPEHYTPFLHREFMALAGASRGDNFVRRCPLVRLAVHPYQEADRLGPLLVLPRREGDDCHGIALGRLLNTSVRVLGT